MDVPANLPVPMRDLTESNALLGDRAALDAAWDRDGYWFFRGVLDLGAVERLRDVFRRFLHGYGLVHADDPRATYTGASLDGFPKRLDPLSERKVWKSFVREPAVHAFMRELLQDEPVWVPTVEYRATPPEPGRSSLDAAERVHFMHQDGFYNKGIPFRICWIPLVEIDERVGGLILGEGLHRGPLLHDSQQPPLYPIPPGVVPAERLRRATYRPGDLLMMHLDTPHSGLTNLSDRFRLSMDIRVLPKRINPLVIGVVRAASQDAVEIETEDGARGRYSVDAETYRRGLDGKEVPHEQFAARFAPGCEVLAVVKDGRVATIRPVH